MKQNVWAGMASRLLTAVLLLMMAGCATYSQQATSMRDNLLVGRADLAKELAEKEDETATDVLACLNKGMLRRITNDYAGSNQILEVAKQHIESLYGVSVSDMAGSVIINDAIRDYKGDRYEQVLLHAYMAMNYLQLGKPDSARVEMLQADVKMMEWGDQPDEDPFVRYFAGMIFEALGEDDQALKGNLIKEVLAIIPEDKVLSLLPETKESLRSLTSFDQTDLAQHLQAWEQAQAARLKHMVLQFTEQQLETIKEAIKRMMPDVKKNASTSPNKRGTAIFLICKYYLEGSWAK